MSGGGGSSKRNGIGGGSSNPKGNSTRRDYSDEELRDFLVRGELPYPRNNGRIPFPSRRTYSQKNATINRHESPEALSRFTRIPNYVTGYDPPGSNKRELNPHGSRNYYELRNRTAKARSSPAIAPVAPVVPQGPPVVAQDPAVAAVAAVAPVVPQGPPVGAAVPQAVPVPNVPPRKSRRRQNRRAKRTRRSSRR